MFLYLTHTMKLLFNCYFSILLDKLNCLSLCRLIAFAVIFAVNRRDIKKCQASVELQAFFIGVLVVLCLLIINECMIVCISMRGSVMNAAIIASTVMSCCCFHSAISYHFCHSA